MTLAYYSAAFLGAFLLFCVQPMLAKMVLPRFGGSPSVWNTCLLFFQAMLLASYAYAHWNRSRLKPRHQTLLHCGLIALPILALPIAVPGWAAGDHPTFDLLGRLVLAAGLPAFAVAATAPLVQHWHATRRGPRTRDSYTIYAASNAGSLAGLIGYLVLIEPHLTLVEQSRLWALAYALLGALILVCAAGLRSTGGPVAATTDPTPLAPRVVASWVVLSFAPASLLLGVTTFLTTDLAPAPLLWVVPLALYLVTFIAAFAGPPAWILRVGTFALPPAVVLTLALTALLRVRPLAVPHWAVFAAHLSTFTLAALGCHAKLAERRPGVRHLTAYYLAIALGGSLGGLCNTLLAPALFDWPVEYPIILALACGLVAASARPGRPTGGRVGWSGPIGLLLPLLLAAASYAILRGWDAAGRGGPPAPVQLLPAVACLLFARRPARFAVAVASVAVAVTVAQDANRHVAVRERSFFGLLSVLVDQPPGMNTLVHGGVFHGMQRRSADPAQRVAPLLYYSTNGPIGRVFREYADAPITRHVGIIGLGVGSLAAYGRPDREFTFFEIDPAVARIARDPAYFHHLEDCAARWRIELGDARLSLARAPGGRYGLIVLDAFSGDSIPTHLLTCEAMQLYLDKLAPGGLIALHISNDYLDLGVVVAALARDLGLAGLDLDEDIRQVPLGEIRGGRMPAHWVVLARRPADLAPLAAPRPRQPAWRPLIAPPGARAWTDNYSDILSHLRWR